MKIEIIKTQGQAKALVKDLKRQSILSVDTETEGFDRHSMKMCMLQIGNKEQQNLVDLSKVDVQLFKPLLEDPAKIKIIHGSIFDCTWLRHEHGISVHNIYDTMNGEKVMLGVVLPFKPPAGWTKAKLETYKPKYSPKLMYCLQRRGWPDKIELDLDKNPFVYGEKWSDIKIEYSARDIEFLEPLMYDQLKTIDQLRLTNVIELENHVAEIFYQMASTGFYIDVKGWLKYASENEAIYNKAVKQLSKFADINWGAPGQVCKFFGVKYIAELDVLKPPPHLAEAYQYWKDAKRVNKWVNTFGREWLKNVHNNIVYCNYTQIVNTGRISSEQPNLQQIPVKNGAKHRSFFKPRKGNVYCIGDFSGQELAIMAVGSGEPIWLEVLRAGGDLHQKCADLMTKVSGKEVPRRMAKTLNFTMGYGGGALTVQVKLKQDYDIELTESEAQHLINIYFKTFPLLKKWLDNNGASAVKYGKTYSFEPFNRLRVLALEDEDWRKKNIGKNSPVQGTGADMTKLAMHYMNKQLQLKLRGYAFMVHQLHDELVVECSKATAKECKQIMIDSMNKACEMILGEPLSAPDVHIKTDWSK